MNILTSLLQGSAQRKWISKFKTDPYDNTVSTSILCAKAYNADYDGDALNYSLVLDKLLADEFATLDPHYNIPDMSKAYSISGNLSLLSSVTGIVSNYLDNKDISDKVDTVDSQLTKISN